MLQNLGRIGFVFQGSYDSTKSYKKLDVVNYKGGLYAATSDLSPGVIPGANQIWVKMIDGRAAITSSYLYVRKDGNDSNTGLTNDSAGAFLTVEAALDALNRLYDFQGHDCIIHIGEGTWPRISVTDSVTASGLRFLIFEGDGVGVTVIQSQSAGATTPGFLLSRCAVNLYIRNMTISQPPSPASNSAPVRITSAQVDISDCEIDGDIGTTGYGIYAANGSIVSLSNISMKGTFSTPFLCTTSAQITTTGNFDIQDITVSGSVVAVQDGANWLTGNTTVWSGSATGKRYNVTNLSLFNSNGGGVNLVPGTSAGTTSGGAQYV